MFENPTVNLGSLCKSCVKIKYCSSRLIFAFLYADSSIQNASEQFVSCVHLPIFLISFFIHPHKQKCNGVMSGNSHISTWVTIHNQPHVHMTDAVTSENISFFTWISLYRPTCCIADERNGIICFRLEIWKLREFVFITETDWVPCEGRAEAEETVKPRSYSTA